MFIDYCLFAFADTHRKGEGQGFWTNSSKTLHLNNSKTLKTVAMYDYVLNCSAGFKINKKHREWFACAR